VEIIPLKKSEYFRERYQNGLGLKDVELLAKDIEEYLDKKPRDLDSIIILLFCYVKIHEMDKAEHRLKLTNMSFRFERTPPPILLIEALLKLHRGMVKKGLEVLESIQIEDLDFMEKCRVFSSLALYRSNLGLLQKSYETLLNLNNLVNKDKPFNIDDPEFQKHLKTSLGDAPAIVLLDTIRSYQGGLDFLKTKKYLEIFNYTKELVENNKDVITLYPFVQSDWEYPIIHFAICLTTSPMSMEDLIKIERFVIEEIEKKYPDDFVVISAMPEEELVSA
jgi:hypothetical protein